MRILLSAYDCDPTKGSENGRGWAWVRSLTERGHQVHLLTASRNRENIEEYRDSRFSELSVTYVDERVIEPKPSSIRSLPFASRIVGEHRAMRWQADIVPAAETICSEHSIDLIHHVTNTSIRRPSYLWKVGPPTVLGPLAGGVQVPLRLRQSFPLHSHATEILRDASNMSVSLRPATRRSLQNARWVFVDSEATRQLLPRSVLARSKAVLMVADPKIDETQLTAPVLEDGMKLLYVGRFEHWKGIHLALRAIAEARRMGSHATLTAIGAGRDLPWLQRLSERLGIEDHVRWLSWRPREQLKELYLSHSALIFPSLHDTSPNAIVEGFGYFLPAIVLDIGGPGEMVNDGCGRRIPVSGVGERQAVESLRNAICELDGDAELQFQLKQGAKKQLEQLRWESAVDKIYHTIEATGDHSPAPTPLQCA